METDIAQGGPKTLTVSPVAGSSYLVDVAQVDVPNADLTRPANVSPELKNQCYA